jgi:hypothetical protein
MNGRINYTLTQQCSVKVIRLIWLMEPWGGRREAPDSGSVGYASS